MSFKYLLKVFETPLKGILKATYKQASRQGGLARGGLVSQGP